MGVVVGCACKRVDVCVVPRGLQGGVLKMDVCLLVGFRGGRWCGAVVV